MLLNGQGRSLQVTCSSAWKSWCVCLERVAIPRLSCSSCPVHPSPSCPSCFSSSCSSTSWRCRSSTRRWGGRRRWQWPRWPRWALWWRKKTDHRPQTQTLAGKPVIAIALGHFNYNRPYVYLDLKVLWAHREEKGTWHYIYFLNHYKYH